jgi:hypothetical protein
MEVATDVVDDVATVGAGEICAGVAADSAVVGVDGAGGGGGISIVIGLVDVSAE